MPIRNSDYEVIFAQLSPTIDRSDHLGKTPKKKKVNGLPIDKVTLRATIISAASASAAQSAVEKAISNITVLNVQES